jgi:hypothetical protein
MLTGLILRELTRRHSFTLPVVGALSVLFAVYFLSNFFGSRYAAVSFNDWEGPVRQTAELASRSQDWSAFDAVTRGLPDVATRYFLIEYGGETCESSKDRLSEMRDRRG